MADLVAPLYSAAGAEKGTVELNPEIFGIEPQSLCDASGCRSAACRPSLRHCKGQDSCGSTRRWPQAMAPEGSRSGTAWIHSITPVGWWWSRPWADAT